MPREEYKALFVHLEGFIKQEEERIDALLCTQDVTFQQYITAQEQKEKAIHRERQNVYKRIAHSYEEAIEYIGLLIEENFFLGSIYEDAKRLKANIDNLILGRSDNNAIIRISDICKHPNNDPISLSDATKQYVINQLNEKKRPYTLGRGRKKDGRTLFDVMLQAELDKGGRRSPLEAEFEAKRKYAKLRKEFKDLNDAKSQYECIRKYYASYGCFGAKEPTYTQLKDALPNIAPKSTYNDQKKPKKAK